MASESCTVMLERESLQNLMRISDSPTLRDKICTHYLSKDIFNHYFRQCKPISEHIDDDDTNSMSDVYNYNIPDDARYIDGMREAATIDSNNKGFYQRYLELADFTSSLAVAYLIRAMTNSTNCDKICISDAGTPWGLDRLENSLGFELCTGFDPYSRDSWSFVEHVLWAALAAHSISCIQVTELDICLGLASDRDSDAITGNALCLSRSTNRRY
ncbi:hypothetical protein E5D57_011075 [Metarhizium anisopliae]|nr:hypothetical protein E5D57_011075 [Metarhizium anisopliae]